nr:olfactory receptor 10C1-like [Pelodiscus sinensis]|eukprot:XP_006132735.1 olfactory receptor 10C1-like [Pelodiscus sinensis]
MSPENHTTVTGFILLGLSEVPIFQPLVFAMLLCLYIVTVMANTLIVVIINADHTLHTPMYFFLTQLSCLEVCYTSITIPKMLESLANQADISFMGCAMQMFFFLFFGVAECFFLASMAFDRYVAICDPLRYTVVVSRRLCGQLALGSWACGAAVGVGHTVFIFSLPFCGSLIDHFFCEIQPLMELLCGGPSLNAAHIIAVAVLAIVVPFLLIIFSYSCITATILRMSSSAGRHKAFSTCSSHLAVVTLFYGTVGFMYLRPKSSYFPPVDKLVSLLYAVVTPLLNPIIYSLRNKEVKGALRKLWNKMFSL